MKALEQVLHMLWGGLALVPVLISPGPIGGAISGVLLALPRELVDQWPINRIHDTILDLFFFGLGGAIAGAVVVLWTSNTSWLASLLS